jgi:catalase-peroxidase
MEGESKCPVTGRTNAYMNRDWWPKQLDLRVLHRHSALADPMGAGFDYAKEFNSLDLDAVIRDLRAVMTDSQDWWPADFGHYGPFFIRMAWHSAGHLPHRRRPRRRRRRAAALRAAQQLAGQCQPRQGAPAAVADQAEIRPQDLLGRPADPRRQRRAGIDGLQDLRLRRRARDAGSPRRSSIGAPRARGSATSATAANATSRTRSAAVQMGLIYVNPEGPNGKPDPLAAARDIRETFARMAMNDEETVALIAGGHTFGKTHGAGDATLVGPEPEAAPIEEQGLGWKSKFGSGKGATRSPAASR